LEVLIAADPIWIGFSVALATENFYVCQPVSFYKSQQEIQKVNPLYAFKVATAYFREQGKVPVFEDSNCRLIKL
jgi:hypothetical protein